MPLNQQLVFIIGAPRSGTTWLQAMLAAHEAVCTSEELHLYKYISPWPAIWQEQEAQNKESGLNVGLSSVMSQDDLHDFMRDFLVRIYARVAEKKPQASIIVDKQPMYALNVHLLNQLMPETIFVHIIRDGRDVAASWLAASKDWGRVWATGDINAAARAWKLHVTKGREAQAFGDRYIEIRYEDLQTDGVNMLQAVFDRIGLSLERSAVEAIYAQHSLDKMRKNYTTQGDAQPTATPFAVPKNFFRKGKVGGWREDLSPLQSYRLYTSMNALLRELGYAKDDAWWYRNPVEQRVLPWLSRLHSLGARVYGRLNSAFNKPS